MTIDWSVGADDAAPARAESGTECVGQEFDPFFRANYRRTVQLAALLTGSPSAAEDIAQDAFVRVAPKLAGLEFPEAYLRTTTVNLSKNWSRGRFREAERLRGSVPMSEGYVDPADELLASLHRLPYRQRAVVVLRYWLDYSEAQIAETIGCRPGTVKSLNARALARIRKEIP